MERRKQVKEDLNPGLKLSTILPTMYDERTNLAKEIKEKILEIFRDALLNTTIPRNFNHCMLFSSNALSIV